LYTELQQFEDLKRISKTLLHIGPKGCLEVGELNLENAALFAAI